MTSVCNSTATTVPMADGSNAEERHHRFQWTTTITEDRGGRGEGGNVCECD